MRLATVEHFEAHTARLWTGILWDGATLPEHSPSDTRSCQGGKPMCPTSKTGPKNTRQHSMVSTTCQSIWKGMDGSLSSFGPLAQTQTTPIACPESFGITRERCLWTASPSWFLPSEALRIGHSQPEKEVSTEQQPGCRVPLLDIGQALEGQIHRVQMTPSPSEP